MTRRPLPQRRPARELLFRGRPGLVLEDLTWVGRMTLLDCPGAVVRNCEGYGGKAGLRLEACPGALVEDCDFHHAEHHGVACAGLTPVPIVLRRVRAFENYEDGIQLLNGFDGLVHAFDCDFFENAENGADIKDGDFWSADSRYVDNGTGKGSGGGREQIIAHQGDPDLTTHAGAVTLVGCLLRTRADVEHSACLRSDGPHLSVSLTDTVLDARPGRNGCLRLSNGSSTTLQDCRLLGGADKPLVRGTEGARAALLGCAITRERDDGPWFEMDDWSWDGPGDVASPLLQLSGIR